MMLDFFSFTIYHTFLLFLKCDKNVGNIILDLIFDPQVQATSIIAFHAFSVFIWFLSLCLVSSNSPKMHAP